MSQKSYSGSIALSKLKHVIMKKKGKGKGKIECLVIPIDANYLVRGKEGAVYMPVRVIAKSEEDKYGQHGFISQSVDSKIYKEADEEERGVIKALPILGNIKNFEAGGGGNDNSGAAAKEAIDENDDLPF
jgi:hypothetical protein